MSDPLIINLHHSRGDNLMADDKNLGGDDPTAKPVDKPGVPPVVHQNDKGESVMTPIPRPGDPVGPVLLPGDDAKDSKPAAKPSAS